MKLIGRIGSTLTLLGVTCSLIAIAPAALAADVEKTEVSIAVGGKSSFYYLPLTLAQRLGYFKDEGLNVEVNDFAGGSKALQAVVGGSADVVSGAYEHIIDMQAKGQPFKAFVLQGRSPDVAIGVATAKLDSYKSPADLKGMTVGVTAPGSSTHIILSHFLVQNGLKPTDVAIVGVGATAGAVAALRAGKIDAISNIDPAITMLESSGDLKVIADGRTAAGAKALFGGPLPAGCLYAPTAFIESNPKTVQAMATAVVRALKWLQTATPEQVAATVPPEYLVGDKSLYMSTFEKVRESYSPDGIVPDDGAAAALKMVSAFNSNVSNASIKLDLTYDNRFAETAGQAVK
jgi:NitT/TauT family transport system substrate-binding protein